MPIAIVPEMTSFGAGPGKTPVVLADVDRAYTVRIAAIPAVVTLAERYMDTLSRGGFRRDAG